MLSAASDNFTTGAEFVLRQARALLAQEPKQAANLLLELIGQTANPRLKTRIAPITSFIDTGRRQAAERWLDCAIEYEAQRRGQDTISH